MRTSLTFVLALGAMMFLAGCGHKPAQVAVPPAPSIEQPPSAPESSETKAPETSGEAAGESNEEAGEVPPDAKPLLVETGIASWYGAPYHNRRASNGEIYDMHAMTAAHRTLPLGSIVRVTCVENGEFGGGEDYGPRAVHRGADC